MSINEISKKFVLSKDTLRYWEKVGLLPAIKRDNHGYRQYSEIDQNWIFYIKVLRNAGMPVSQLKVFLFNYRQKETAQKRLNLLIKQREQLEQQQAQLQKTINYLNYKIDHFDDKLLTYEKEKLAYEQKI
ncbi:MULTISPECIES: MerR family transcriptional regulator [unclassified Lactobacillus]|uniref:MerR family transcriptional regulator n=1 Tax=unclassified Lactobacillus TaxID=2620435 RepID=UPI000EFAB721|nr:MULTISPECIES: MerR family transcriptional regulator [unclassified Lactobacillus]RMC46495.1 MerR family transcriptional regulator [Lactobacillus sp. ESL0230]RMC50797.1 MerR family transcriptional regulator [Lactobacillus sp. ESL0225]